MFRFGAEFPDNCVPEVRDLVRCVAGTKYIDDFLRLCEQLLARLLADEGYAGVMVSAHM